MCNVGILHRAQIGQNAYTEYVRTIYIYIEREFSVFTTSVGLAALAPINHTRQEFMVHKPPEPEGEGCLWNINSYLL